MIKKRDKLQEKELKRLRFINRRLLKKIKRDKRRKEFEQQEDE